jgi:putative membrane protein
VTIDRLILSTVLLLLGLFVASSTALAQQPLQHPQPYPQQTPGQYPNSNAQQQQQTAPNAMTDEQFAKKAAEGGMAEVKLGELAAQNGNSESVKNFGKKMVEDHSKANEELKQTASKDNISLPTGLNKHDQAVYDKLSKLSGDAFDRAYAKDMVRDHQNDVAEFKAEASNGQNPDIKTFASSTLPTLEQHLQLAREMNRTVQGSGGKTSGTGSR